MIALPEKRSMIIPYYVDKYILPNKAIPTWLVAITSFGLRYERIVICY